MHSQLSSASLFALAFAELQDHAGSPGGAHACHTTVGCLKASSHYARVVTRHLFLSHLLYLFFFGGFFFYICFGFVLTLYLSPSPRRATARAPVAKGPATAIATDRSLHDRAQIKRNHLLVCMLVLFDRQKKKKKEQSHTSRCARQLHLPDLLLYHNAIMIERNAEDYI